MMLPQLGTFRILVALFRRIFGINCEGIDVGVSQEGSNFQLQAMVLDLVGALSLVGF